MPYTWRDEFREMNSNLETGTKLDLKNKKNKKNAEFYTGKYNVTFEITLITFYKVFLSCIHLFPVVTFHAVFKSRYKL